MINKVSITEAANIIHYYYLDACLLVRPNNFVLLYFWRIEPLCTYSAYSTLKLSGITSEVTQLTMFTVALLTLLIKRVYVCLAKFGMRSCGGSLITSVIPMTVFARRPCCCRYCGGGGGGSGSGAGGSSSSSSSSSSAFYKVLPRKK